MAFKVKSRVRDTTTGTATGPFTVLTTGLPSRHRTFSAVYAVGDTFPGFIEHQAAEEWVEGLFRYTGTNQITVDEVWDGTNGVGVAVSFSAGTKDIGVVTPARGAFAPYNFLPGGRLTFVSGAPIMSSIVSAGATVYYTPYIHNMLPLWDGVAFVPAVFSELSQALTDTTKSPAAAAANQVYDMFVWNDAGTIRCTRGPTWATGGGSNTARGTGAGSTALTRTQGKLVNSVAITNGPAAGYGLYVGSIMTDTSAAAVTWRFARVFVSNSVVPWFGLWNAYNRIKNQGRIIDNANGAYSYGTGAYREAAGSAFNHITFLVGDDTEAIEAWYNMTLGVGASGSASFAIGFDSSTSLDNELSLTHRIGSLSSSNSSVVGGFKQAFGAGKHSIYALEFSNGGTLSFNPDAANSLFLAIFG